MIDKGEVASRADLAVSTWLFVSTWQFKVMVLSWLPGQEIARTFVEALLAA